MNTLKKILVTFTFSLLSIAFTSNATPITAWDFIVDSAFTGPTVYTAGTGTPTESNTNIFFGAPTTLAWGDQVTQSSLDISSGNNGNVTGFNLANGDSAQTALLVHNNIAIPGASSVLESTVLSTVLQITPTGFPFPITPPPAIAFDIFFKETPNVAGICGGVACSNDIFVITMPAGVIFDQGEGTLNQQFGIGQYTYNTELRLISTTNGSGLSVLNNTICDRVPGATNGCIGLTTVEGESNEFQVMMRITQVPEPSGILLMSLALFGIFASMRNKHI
ncbi:THxN family PEP-CTERM protein [Litorilituus lipolyticus]|uniref:PEP-CTERM sorting domain-containing protein n=1 Tax=Litorilituus lipolyticus TaxID=2491017 RepID=A0A502KTX1_9GAMM|nr:THxN family PEP-CTERM protein [Litorilituus lipolyticus]TPH15170.1 PEP-CTERM sorting domain-containing protein [Litorilituus lipolyticus]